jgi:hypothetical protein
VTTTHPRHALADAEVVTADLRLVEIATQHSTIQVRVRPGTVGGGGGAGRAVRRAPGPTSG